MFGNVKFESGLSESKGVTPESRSDFEQDPYDRLDQIKNGINKALDRVSELKDFPKDHPQKIDLWKTLRNLTRQLRELEEKLGIKPDFSVSEE
jgi:hypothetical protein